MTEQDPDAQPDPTTAATTDAGVPAQERVARLLAAAASDAPPLPDAVARRLDEALSALVAERDGSPVAGPEVAPVAGAGERHEEGRVVDLRERRRRRWPGVLVAAATVSVVGLGVGTMLGSGSGGDSASTDAVSTLDEGAAGGAAEPEAAAPDPSVAAERDAELDGSETETRTQGGQPPSPEALAADSDASPPRLSAASLVPDAQRIEDFGLAAPAPTPRLERRCVDTGTSAGDTWLRIRLDGEPAVLVLRAPNGGRRTAEVFTCDDPATSAATARIDER